MSAVAQQDFPYSLSRQRISELDLLRSIGHITWTADQEESALSAFAAALLRLPGVTGFRFEPDGTAESPHPRPSLFEITKERSGAPLAFASSQVLANGKSYGQPRLFFDPRASLLLESPLRLAKFIGQQIGLLLHRLALRREQQRLSAHLRTIDRAIRREKRFVTPSSSWRGSAMSRNPKPSLSWSAMRAAIAAICWTSRRL